MTSGGELLAGVGAAASGGHCLQRLFQTERIRVKCESLERPASAESRCPRSPAKGPYLAPKLRKRSRTMREDPMNAGESRIGPEGHSAAASTMPNQRAVPKAGDVLVSTRTARADLYEISVLPT